MLLGNVAEPFDLYYMRSIGVANETLERDAPPSPLKKKGFLGLLS